MASVSVSNLHGAKPLKTSLISKGNILTNGTDVGPLIWFPEIGEGQKSPVFLKLAVIHQLYTWVSIIT